MKREWSWGGFETGKWDEGPRKYGVMIDTLGDAWASLEVMVVIGLRWASLEVYTPETRERLANEGKDTGYPPSGAYLGDEWGPDEKEEVLDA